MKGVFFLIDAAAEIMRQRAGGKIINIASVATFVSSAKYTLYCAVKSAILALTR